jgi:hypothetical protein
VGKAGYASRRTASEAEDRLASANTVWHSTPQSDRCTHDLALDSPDLVDRRKLSLAYDPIFPRLIRIVSDTPDQQLVRRPDKLHGFRLDLYFTSLQDQSTIDGPRSYLCVPRQSPSRDLPVPILPSRRNKQNASPLHGFQPRLADLA